LPFDAPPVPDPRAAVLLTTAASPDVADCLLLVGTDTVLLFDMAVLLETTVVMAFLDEGPVLVMDAEVRAAAALVSFAMNVLLTVFGALAAAWAFARLAAWAALAACDAEGADCIVVGACSVDSPSTSPFLPGNSDWAQSSGATADAGVTDRLCWSAAEAIAVRIIGNMAANEMPIPAATPAKPAMNGTMPFLSFMLCRNMSSAMRTPF